MCGITIAIDLVHDTCHLFTRSRIDGIKAMCSRGISRGKQVIKFANTSNAVEFVYSRPLEMKTRTRTRTTRTGMTDWGLERERRPRGYFGGKQKHLANR